METGENVRLRDSKKRIEKVQPEHPTIRLCSLIKASSELQLQVLLRASNLHITDKYLSLWRAKWIAQLRGAMIITSAWTEPELDRISRDGGARVASWTYAVN